MAVEVLSVPSACCSSAAKRLPSVARPLQRVRMPRAALHGLLHGAEELNAQDTPRLANTARRADRLSTAEQRGKPG
jgi:hypothetical protein